MTISVLMMHNMAMMAIMPMLLKMMMMMAMMVAMAAQIVPDLVRLFQHDVQFKIYSSRILTATSSSS